MNPLKNSKHRAVVIAILIVFQILCVRYVKNAYTGIMFHGLNFVYFMLGFLSTEPRQALKTFSWTAFPVIGFIVGLLLWLNNTDIRNLMALQRFEISLNVWLFTMVTVFFSFYLGRAIRLLLLRAKVLIKRIVNR